MYTNTTCSRPPSHFGTPIASWSWATARSPSQYRESKMTSRSRSVATPSPFSSSDSNSIEQEQPHLSARAYVGSLVKQLSSSPSAARSKAQHLHTMSSSDQHQLPRQGHDEQAPALKPQMKKQTRRRVHTIRPYQERLLNMAEARREIVTALRIHRANMRQQSKYQQEQQRQRPRLQQPAVQVIFKEQSQAFERVLPVATNYASAAADNHLCSSPFANLVAGAPSGNYSSSMLSYDLAPLQEEAPAAVGGLEQLVCNLPAQPLGLNLSFQGFDGASLDKANKNSDDPFGVPLIQPSSPCPAAASYSAYSSPVTAMAGHRYSSADAPAELSQVLDGEVEMSYSIGSGGERQGTELMSETTAANVGAASAWWTKMLESMESGGETAGAEVGKQADAMVVGAGRSEWLCDGVGVGVEQDVAAGPKPEIMETMHVFDGDYSGYYEGDHGDNGGDIALQCVDVEGWDDGEWFS